MHIVKDVLWYEAPHHYRSRPAEDLRRYQGASVFFFGPSSSRRDGVILFVSMDGKSPRLAASAVSVVVAASVMLLTQRPGLGRIFQSQFRYLAASMKGIRVRHGWRTVGALGYLLGLAVLTHRFVALRTLKLRNQKSSGPIAIFLLHIFGYWRKAI